MLTELLLPQQSVNNNYQTYIIGPNNSFTASNTTGFWYEFKVPQCSFVYIFTVGGGGGGATAQQAASLTAAGGGGGGGSSAVTDVLIPRIFLPKTIWISVGCPGLGATAAATSGGTGGNTYVAVRPTNPNNSPAGVDTLCYSTGGTGGSAGASGGGAGGAAGGISTLGNMLRGCAHAVGGRVIANISLAGQAGAAGGANTGANGGSITYPTTGLLVSGGAGGGGKSTATTNFTGGIITGTASSHIPTGIASSGSSSTASNGACSLAMMDLTRLTFLNGLIPLSFYCGEATGTAAETGNIIDGWLSTGGGGGSAYGGAAGYGGAGGFGGFGSGGGGAGPGDNLTANAGNGGSGLCIIACL